MERELFLLGLLRQHDMHGYKLAEFIEGDLAICVDLKKPTAYFLLDKMAQQGWIAYSEAQEGNRPTRRVYRITPEGEAAFQKMLREVLAGYTLTKFSDDIALAFADTLPTDEALALLHEKREHLVHELDHARAIPSHPGRVQLIIDHRLFHLESELRWIDQVIERFGHESRS